MSTPGEMVINAQNLITLIFHFRCCASAYARIQQNGPSSEFLWVKIPNLFSIDTMLLYFLDSFIKFIFEKKKKIGVEMLMCECVRA